MKRVAWLCDIDALKARSTEYRPLTQGKLEHFRDELIVNYTYNSNAIKGNTLTLAETALVIREGITIGGKSVKEPMEIIDIKNPNNMKNLHINGDHNPEIEL